MTRPIIELDVLSALKTRKAFSYKCTTEKIIQQCKENILKMKVYADEIVAVDSYEDCSLIFTRTENANEVYNYTYLIQEDLNSFMSRFMKELYPDIV